MNRKSSSSRVLVVGAGPAGLEAAHALGKRGYEVMLAEATRELGGRVTLESRLPGLSEWARVRDYRLQQIEKMDHVEVFRESELSVEAILETGADHVAIATGAKWRADGYGRSNMTGISDVRIGPGIFTPDDILAGRIPDGPTIIFDDDSYYMATVIAELVRERKLPVTLVTPDDTISAWGAYTYDRWRAQTKLMEMGVELVTAHNLRAFDGTTATLSCQYTNRDKNLPAENLVLVTTRLPNDQLYKELSGQIETTASPTIKSVRRIGDCDAPAIIAAAVYSGHRYARELECDVDRDNPLKHDRVFFENG